MGAAEIPLEGKQVNIDGKTVRRSHQRGKGIGAVHLVSTFVAEHGLVLGQRATEEKSNEITAIPELLQALSLKGCIVSGSARMVASGNGEKQKRSKTCPLLHSAPKANKALFALDFCAVSLYLRSDTFVAIQSWCTVMVCLILHSSFIRYTTNMTSQCLQSLTQSVLHKFNGISGNHSTIPNTIPILYFGDADAYFQSQRRIISVALNPSDIEFLDPSFSTKTHSVSFRFPSAISGNISNIVAAYNEYFKKNPYHKWFQHFEPLLNGMDASYYDHPQYSNRVLHTDLLSPFATHPKWSALSPQDQNTLTAIGIPTWHELVECLQPDVIIASVARDHLKNISYLPLSPIWLPISSKTVKKKKTNTYSISIADPILLSSGKKTKFVYGTAGKQPLFGLTAFEKKNAGKNI